MAMGKFQRRVMITPQATLLGWRRLNPERMAYSGQMKFFQRIKIGDRKYSQVYVPYIEFDLIVYYPEMSGRWEAHYLGEKDGVFTTLFIKNASRIESNLL